MNLPVIMRHVVLIILLIVFTVFASAGFIEGYLPLKRDAALKKAVQASEISGDYIICTRDLVGFYDWKIVENHAYDADDMYIMIIGPKPFSYIFAAKPSEIEYDFSRAFWDAKNKYIFYVSDRKEEYIDEVKEVCVQYYVTGWDILYPVDHGTVFGLLKSPRYIFESDLYSE